MISIENFDILKDNKASLHELSKDDHDNVEENFMTDSEILAVNFDEVKRQYVNQLRHSEDDAYSVDAIFQNERGTFFIEFKNGKVKSSNVRWKVFDSILIFSDITNASVEWMRNNVEFILVYNAQKNYDHNAQRSSERRMTPSLRKIAKYKKKKGNQEFIRFNLERFQGLYFRRVHTYDEIEFEEYIHSEKM